MSELLFINGIHYISTADAGKIYKYTSDYITKLARENKIEATRMGRFWYVSPESLDAFIQKMEKQKNVRGVEIRAERKQEHYKHISVQHIGERNIPTDSLKNKLLALQQTAVVLVLGLSVGLSSYFISLPPALNQQASVVESSINTLERFARALYHFISPENTTYVATEVEIKTVQPYEETNTTGTTTYTSLIVGHEDVFTEEQVATVRDSFSDEIEISVDPLNPDTGIITPIFRDRRGEEYRYLMMPINLPKSSP